MKKVIDISGMNCQHCVNNVANALNEIDGVKAKVNLNKKQAVVSLSKDVDNNELSKAITDVGYEVLAIKDKKGLL